MHYNDRYIGSLDVKKNQLTSCLANWKGQFEGEEGYPTIGPKGVAIIISLHGTFGFSGALNDINIWDRFPLYEMLIDETQDEN